MVQHKPASNGGSDGKVSFAALPAFAALALAGLLLVAAAAGYLWGRGGDIQGVPGAVSTDATLNRACSAGFDDRASALCAQWKAADAAERSAWWAAVSVAVGAIGTAGLFWTLFYTRRSVVAAIHAGAHTEASLEVARQTAERQLRAYISVEDFEVEDFIVGKRPRFRLKVINRGQTPAFAATRKTTVVQSACSGDETRVTFGGEAFRVTRVLAPGQVSQHTRRIRTLTADQHASVLAGTLHFVFAGLVKYKDAYGRKRRLTFKFVLNRRSLDSSGTARLSACRSGNQSN